MYCARVGCMWMDGYPCRIGALELELELKNPVGLLHVE